MATYKAKNKNFRHWLFAAGFTPVGEDRVQAPPGMNHRQGRSAMYKVFVEAVCVEPVPQWKIDQAAHNYCSHCGTMPRVSGFMPFVGLPKTREIT
jgi:hypothetical protein